MKVGTKHLFSYLWRFYIYDCAKLNKQILCEQDACIILSKGEIRKEIGREGTATPTYLPLVVLRESHKVRYHRGFLANVVIK